MGISQSSIVIVVPGDLHLTEAGLDNHRAAEWVVEQVNNLIRPDFVQFIGDNVQDALPNQFNLFRALRDRLEIPHHAIVGDHDVKDDPSASGFRRQFDGTYGSTTLRGFRFIRLDTQQAKPVGISPEQIQWLEGELNLAEVAGERVVIFQHNYPFQIWENFAGPGLDRWRSLVQTRRIFAIVCGHTHYWQVANDGRNVYAAMRSIGDPEGGAAGFGLICIDGDDLAWIYRTQDDSGPIVLITHPRERILATGPSHVISGADQVRARVWSSSRVVSARARIGHRSWFPLVAGSDRMWSAPIDPGQLSKGEHTLIVEAEDQTGQVGRHRIAFAVDPTGRYTPVPEVHPRVSETEYC